MLRYSQSSPGASQVSVNSAAAASADRSIRAIVFDFGRVICTFDLQRLIANLSRVTGAHPDEVRAHMPAVGALAVHYETGLLTSDEFFRKVSSLTGVHLEQEVFRQAYCDIFTPIPTTHELIRALKPHYKLALVSNTSEWHFEYGIKPVEVFPLFDTVTLSFQVGAMKPAEEVYRDALRKLELPARACVYIDDLAENVRAAAGLGFHAIHYTSPTALLAALDGLGIRRGEERLGR